MGKNVAFFPHPNWIYKIKTPRDSRFSGAEFTRCDVITSADRTEDKTSGKLIKNCKNKVPTGILYNMGEKNTLKGFINAWVFSVNSLNNQSFLNPLPIKWVALTKQLVKERALQTLRGTICRRSCGLYHVWQILSAGLLRQEWLI